MSDQMIPTPSEFSKYTLEKELGHGGMGGVYLGRDNMLDRKVAIKVMLKSYGDDPTFVERFKKEAQAAAKLSHPNIAQVYDFDLYQGQPYISMELVSGGSLDKKMEKTPGQLDPYYVMKIGLQMAEALGAAADRGLVHGDVKPENILFGADGTAKLVDFGLAAMQGDTGEIWGTPYYISPEKVRRMKVDFRADIYSLGGTLYHAITGVAPFEGADATEVVKARFIAPPKKPSEVRPGIDPKIDSIILRMLELEPSKRYPTYESLKGDISRYLDKASPTKTGPVGSGKKIVLKGRNGGAMIAPSGASVGAGSAPAAPVAPPPPKNIAAIVGAVIGGVILLILLVAFGLVWYVHSSRAREAAAFQRDVIDRQTEARASIGKSLKNAESFASDLETFCGEAVKTVEESTDKALECFRTYDENSPVTRELLVPPPPQYLLDAMKPKAPEATEDKPADGEKAAEPAAEKQPEAAPSAEEAAGEASMPQGISPTVQNAITRLHELWNDAYACSAAVVVVRARMSELDTFKEKMNALTVEDAPTTEALGKLSRDVSAAVSDLKNLPEVANAQRKKSVISTKSKSTLDSLEKNLRDAKKHLDDAARAQQLADEMKAEAERKREEHQKKVEEEMAAVDAKFASIQNTLLKNLACDLAISQLDGMIGGREGLTTTEAKGKLNAYVLGVKYMKGVLEYFGKNVKGYKLPVNVGEGATITSNLRGKKYEVEITPAKPGSKKLTMSWDLYLAKNAAPFNELIKDFVERGMNNERLGLKLSLMDWSKHMMGSALLLRTLYGDSKSAMERAEKLVRKAVEKFESCRTNAQLVFPDIDFDGGNGGANADDEDL